MAPTRQAPPPASRQTGLIIWWVLAASLTAFAVVATAVGPSLWPGNRGVAEILALVAVGMALLQLVMSRVVPSRAKLAPGATPDAVALTKTIIASALNEGAALFAVVAWMIGGSPLALAALTIAVAGLLLAFPSAARWQRLGGTIAATAARPSRMVRMR